MAQLNVDVLRLIWGFLTDVPTVLAFSLTCSALRPTAVERRLSIRPITIVGAKSTRDLYIFIFVDGEQRGRHIRSMTVPVQPVLRNPPEELVDRLLAVLASATHLRTLSLYVPGEPLTLLRHPRLRAVVARMTSLQEFFIISSVRVANQLLGSTHSALKTFRHSDVYEGYQRSLLLSTMAPQLASTLQEVEMSLNFLSTAFHSSTSFPGVRSVTLTCVSTLFWLNMLLAVFPHLDRTLIVEDSIHVDDIYRLEALREENRTAQVPTTRS